MPFHLDKFKDKVQGNLSGLAPAASTQLDVLKQIVGNRGLENRRADSRQRFSELINEIIGRGRDLTDAPRLTAEDLFGEQMSRLTRSARASGNQAKQAFSRSLLGGAGDVSGAAGAGFLGATQGTNQNIGDLAVRFETLADRINRERRGRGEGLLRTGLSGTQNLFTTDINLLEAARNRKAQKEQARKQRWASIIGSALGAGGAAIACWVAETLYGKDDIKVASVRKFLAEHDGTDGQITTFIEDYRENGRRWALEVKKNPRLRHSAEKLFRELHELSKAA